MVFVFAFAFVFVFLSDLKRILWDVGQLIYFGICWIPLWRSPKGKCVTHTMFMKFQTLSQSFDQILRYGPLVTDAMLPLPKMHKIMFTNDKEVPWRNMSFFREEPMLGNISKEFQMFKCFERLFANVLKKLVCLFFRNGLILDVDAWLYSSFISFPSSPHLIFWKCETEYLQWMSFVLGNISKAFQMFFDQTFLQIY